MSGIVSVNGERFQHGALAHVRFLADQLSTTPAGVLEQAAYALDHEYSGADIHHTIAVSVQQVENLRRQLRSRVPIPAGRLARVLHRYAWGMVLVGVLAARADIDRDVSKEMAALSEKFQEKLDLFSARN